MSNFFQAAKRKVFTRTPFCPLLFNTCSEELSRNLRILQRRGGILSRPYRLFWSSKYFTPFRTVMSTPGSRCKPPANRTRTPDFHNRQNRNSRESSTFPIIFFPMSPYEHILNRQLHVCNKPKRKKHVFPTHLSEGWVNDEPLSLSARRFFCYPNIHKF